ncbi:MAG: amino acid-binding protein [Lachnospiraceae bacterium]|nr:amino acid-binding protein [Lachnospiraceae bacterium]
MFIKQLSVFIENEEGRLEEVLDVLKEEQINIISLSLADTSEYGILRLITAKPEAAQSALKSKGFTARLTDVLAVRLSHQVGTLQEILGIVCKAGLNVEYTYVLSNKEDDSSIICKISNGDEAAELLESREVKLFSQEDIARVFQ